MSVDLFGEAAPEPKAPPRITERDMLDRLNVRFGRTYSNGGYIGRQYVRAEHVPNMPGMPWGRTRIADYIAVDLFESKDRTRMEQDYRRLGRGSSHEELDCRFARSIHGFEVKVSRADWPAELRDPEKAAAWSRYCHTWTLVVSSADIVRDDLPEGWGLMVPHGRSLRYAMRPTRRDPVPMPTGTIATLMRAAMQTEVRLALES